MKEKSTFSPSLFLVLLTASIVCSTVFAAPGEIVFEDDFANRDKWFTSQSSDSLTVIDDSMTQSLDDTGLVVAYLTDAVGETISIHPGQSIKLSYSLSFENLGSGSYFRFGLFDTSDRARLTGDATEGGFSSLVASDSFRDSRGFAVWTNGQNEGRAVDVRRRNASSSSGLVDGSSAFWTANGGDNFSEAITSGTVYHGTLEVFHNGVNNMHFRAAQWRLDDQGEKVYLYDFTTGPDTSGTTYSPDFDLLAFSASRLVADAMTFHSISVEINQADWVTAYEEITAPFDLHFGSGVDQEDGDRLLRSRPEDFVAAASGLQYSPASNGFVSTGALAVVENYQDRQNFVLETEMTLSQLSESGSHRAGLIVLAGPHLEDGVPFNVVGDDGFYSLSWYPSDSSGISYIRIGEGFNGTNLAEEIWEGKVPAGERPIVFQEDFENTTQAWLSGGTPDMWEVGQPEGGPGEAVSPTNVAATGLGSSDQYPTWTDTYFRSPPIDLQGIEEATLEFWEYVDVDPEWEEYHSTQVSILDAETVNDPNPAVLAEFPKEAEPTAEWRFRKFDLPAEAVGREIVIEFRLRSDGAAGNVHDGWFIDDVVVHGPSGPPGPANYGMKVRGEYAQNGDLTLSFTLTDGETEKTVSTMIENPAQGNLFGIGGRSRTASPETGIFDFANLSLELGEDPAWEGTTYAQWRSDHFDPEDDETIAGPGATPAGDNFPNLLKYAFGFEPFVPVTQSEAVQWKIVEDYLQLTYRERLDATDIEYIAEASTDLVNWSTADVEEISREPIVGGEFESVTVQATLESDSATAFLRVEISEK